MEKINKIKKLLINKKIDGYIIPKNDEYFGEYVAEDKDDLKFISNFTGSFGFALILKKNNYLIVDGRYTLQAKIQSGKVFKIITIPGKFPKNIAKNKNLKIGFDPKLFTQLSLFTFFSKTNCKLLPIAENLVKKIRVREKKIKTRKFYLLKKNAVGLNYKKKINKLRENIYKKKIDLHLITAPENIAWLLNLRGFDCKFSPLPNGYLLIDKKNIINFFCDLKKINKKLKKSLKKISIIDINDIENFFSNIKNKKILIDNRSCSIHFKHILNKNNIIIEDLDPIYFLKAIKNKVEIKNSIKSHIHDGVALTKFLFWVQKNFKKKRITEISAQNKLLSLRKNNKFFKFLSFPTISGSGPNGAIIHYKATKKTNRVLKRGDLYLVDSGAQYNFGTTDVTRTISLDNNNERIKNIFTRVLKGHIAVASYKINKNTTGSNIDHLARKYLMDVGLNYAHGTGHGVGYFSNVHEGPYGISKGNKIKLKEGMIISNEPGYYEKNNFGIRIENLVVIQKKNKQIIFNDLTMAPIDKTLIQKKLLNENEINWINKYHSKVFKNLKTFMNKFELVELKKSCSNI